MPARVMVVEDNDMIGSAMRLLFDSSGYLVEVAATARVAVESALASPVGVMFLDLNLPDGDGLGVLARLTSCGKAPVTFAVTGDDDPVVRARCIAAGCRDVLLKPVPIARLLEITALVLSEDRRVEPEPALVV